MTDAPTTEVAVVDPTQYDLPPERAVAITDAFEPMAIERASVTDEYAAIVGQEITQDVCDEAGTLLKRIVKIRTGTAKIHKTQKHLFLKAGQFVDALKNASTEPIVQMEDTLKGIRDHYVNIEAARVAQVEAERVASLEKLEVDPIPSQLALMPDDAWEALYGGYKAAYDARIEEARLAEEKRIEEEQATKKENERLAEENRKQAEALAFAEAETKRIEQEAAKERAERERVEREKKEQEAQAEREREIEQAQAASVENQRAKNGEARDAFMSYGIECADAMALVTAIAKGKIPNVTINY